MKFQREQRSHIIVPPREEERRGAFKPGRGARYAQSSKEEKLHGMNVRSKIWVRALRRANSQHFEQWMPQEKTRAETDRLGLAGAGSFKSMNFVQSISEEDEQCSRKKKTDFVHVLLIKNKTFVTVTDARGNKKTGASAGCLEERKGRSRLSRYAAEATAEHVGRSARKMGLKSVVMKVKGSTYFRKKKKVILSWREGFRGEGVGKKSPIMYIHDVTQLPHNGCRLPKKRRVQIVPTHLNWSGKNLTH
jgi:ribosomal protein S11